MPSETNRTLRVGYFPGCSLLSSGRDYDQSIRSVCAATDVELIEVPDWNCCGATAAHAVNKDLGYALPARILALATGAGLDTVFAPCAACYNRLQTVRHKLSSDETQRERIEDIISRELTRLPRVLNAIEFASEFLMPALSGKTRALFGLRLAAYYGCLLVRPPKEVEFDDAEDPTSMDEMLSQLGAETVDWEYKVECCGGGHSLSRTDIVVDLSGAIVKAAREAGAHGIVTACPMCHSNLDMRQSKIMRRQKTREAMPVYYLTQVLGLAAGIDEEPLGIKRHFVPAGGLLSRAVREAAEK